MSHLSATATANYQDNQHTDNTNDDSAVMDLMEPGTLSLISRVICQEVKSLNSSIGDVVDAVIEKNLQRRGIPVREGLEPRRRSNLVKVAWQYQGTRNMELRGRIFDVVVHDLVTGFINDHIMGNKTDRISPDYEHFRRKTARIVAMEPFPEAQNWKRMSAKYIDHPPAKTWNALSQDLVKHIEHGCWPFIGKSPNGPMNSIKDPDENRFSSLIRSAYELMLKIHGGVSSEYVELMAAKKDEEILGVENIDVLREMEVPPGEQFPCLGQRAFVLGNRGFGLTSTLEDGNRRIYVKVPVTVGKPKFEAPVELPSP